MLKANQDGGFPGMGRGPSLTGQSKSREAQRAQRVQSRFSTRIHHSSIASQASSQRPSKCAMASSLALRGPTYKNAQCAALFLFYDPSGWHRIYTVSPVEHGYEFLEGNPATIVDPSRYSAEYYGRSRMVCTKKELDQQSRTSFEWNGDKWLRFQ